MWHLLWYIQRGHISIDHIHPQVFVNDLTEMKSVVIIYSLNGFSNIEPTSTPDKLVIFYCDQQSIDLLESMMKQCLPWNTGTKFIITANGSRFLPLLERFNRTRKNEESCEIEHCLVMEIDRSVLEETKEKVQRIPDGELNISFRHIS
jgi:uncharacterized protein YlbG (UPF0298 family)